MGSNILHMIIMLRQQHFLHFEKGSRFDMFEVMDF